MKKLILILAVLIGGFLYWKAKQPLIINGDFEAQWVPERVMVMTNHIKGWEVTGIVGLWREGTNTFVCVPEGSTLATRFKARSGMGAQCSFALSVPAANGEFAPWIRRQLPAGAGEHYVHLTPEKGSKVVYLDDFKARTLASRVIGPTGGYAEQSYFDSGGLFSPDDPQLLASNRLTEVSLQLKL